MQEFCLFLRAYYVYPCVVYLVLCTWCCVLDGDLIWTQSNTELCLLFFKALNLNNEQSGRLLYNYPFKFSRLDWTSVKHHGYVFPRFHFQLFLQDIKDSFIFLHLLLFFCFSLKRSATLSCPLWTGPLRKHNCIFQTPLMGVNWIQSKINGCIVNS